MNEKELHEYQMSEAFDEARACFETIIRDIESIEVDDEDFTNRVASSRIVMGALTHALMIPLDAAKRLNDVMNSIKSVVEERSQRMESNTSTSNITIN